MKTGMQNVTAQRTQYDGGASSDHLLEMCGPEMQ